MISWTEDTWHWWKKKATVNVLNQYDQAQISYNFRTGLSLNVLVQGQGPFILGIFFIDLGSLTQKSIYPFTSISVIYQGLHCPFFYEKQKMHIQYHVNDFNLSKCICSCNLKFWINSFSYWIGDFSWDSHLGGVLLSAPFIRTVTALQEENYPKK